MAIGNILILRWPGINPYCAVIDFRRQNVTSTDVSF